MSEIVSFLNEEKESNEHHLFKGHYIGLNIGSHERYSLCCQTDKEKCKEPVIRNQTHETMQLLCEKTKRSICIKCL